MSYQLEREMHDRVTRYHHEAAVRRAIPRPGLRGKLANTLRQIADRIEEQTAGNGLASDQLQVVLQGRNQ